MPKLKLTKSSIDTLPYNSKGQTIYFDTDLTGFGLVVGQNTKTFVAQRQIGLKTVRVTIGRHGVFTADKARARARLLLMSMACGENPNQARRADLARKKSLEETFEEYFRNRVNLRPQTIANYRRILNLHLPDWKKWSLDQITPEIVATRHRKIGKEAGEAAANNAMRIVRAVYNFALAVTDELPPNPVSRLTLTRGWYREQRRQTIIEPHQIAPWFQAVTNFHNPHARDLMLLLLFTGMRRSEALRLTWENVDFQGRTLTVPETKNSEPLVLPLSDFLMNLLQSRRRLNPTDSYVFSGTGATGHLVETKQYVAQIKKLSGVRFTHHDLRRTFVTIAESLDISGYTVKRLVNHKDRHDVTSGYIVLSVERLRAPMQKITDRILQLAERDNCSVQEFPNERHFTTSRA